MYIHIYTAEAVLDAADAHEPKVTAYTYIYRYVYLSIYLSIYLYVCLSVYLSIYLPHIDLTRPARATAEAVLDAADAHETKVATCLNISRYI